MVYPHRERYGILLNRDAFPAHMPDEVRNPDEALRDLRAGQIDTAATTAGKLCLAFDAILGDRPALTHFAPEGEIQ